MRVRSVGYDFKTNLLFVAFELDEESRAAGDYLHQAMVTHEPVHLLLPPPPSRQVESGPVIEGERSE